jgi:hypothetical protein
VADNCGINNTYIIEGDEAKFIGTGDLHERRYDSMVHIFEFSFDANSSYCHHNIHIFPTVALQESFRTNKPFLYAAITCILFSFSGVVFLLYDWFVGTRQQNTEEKANKSAGILQQLFPENVAEKLFEPTRESTRAVLTAPDIGDGETPTIAELYPSATVLCKYMAATKAMRNTVTHTQFFLAQLRTLLASLLGAQ